LAAGTNAAVNSAALIMQAGQKITIADQFTASQGTTFTMGG
jgi:hypothetical protein